MDEDVIVAANSSVIGRRQLLREIGIAGTALLGWKGALFAAAPKETGLAFEGLLKGQSGFHPRQLAPLPHNEIPGFLSRSQLAQNYAAYRTAFVDLIATEQALAVASRSASAAQSYAALRKRQLIAANSTLLHEFYFRNLSPTLPASPSRYVLANIHEHMGSLDDWREDFLACARAAEEWAILVYDPYDDRWHNVAADAQSAGGWAGANPLVVCDVAEHAWATDYAHRESYIERFLDHLDWSVVAARYRSVDRQ